MRLLFAALFFCVIQFTAQAFFEEELIKTADMPYFPNDKQKTWYVSLDAGMSLYGNSNLSGVFNGSVFNNTVVGSNEMKYTPYGGVALGFRKKNSSFIFEFSFQFLASQYRTSYLLNPQDINYGGTNVGSFDVAFRRYKFGATVYYNIANPFNMESGLVGFFFGLGGGVFLERNYINLQKEYNPNGIMIDSTSYSSSTSNPFTGDGNFFYKSNFGIGLYYEASIGVSLDIGSYAMTRIKLKYTVFTSPLLNEKMQAVSQHFQQQWANMHLVSLELSVMLKVN